VGRGWQVEEVGQQAQQQLHVSPSEIAAGEQLQHVQVSYDAPRGVEVAVRKALLLHVRSRSHMYVRYAEEATLGPAYVDAVRVGITTTDVSATCHPNQVLRSTPLV
jgi:hypothetical protein